MAVDTQGNTFVIGQKVARAAKMFQMDGLYVEIVEVTKVCEDKVYLNGSKQPMKFPNRVVIIKE